MAGYANRTIMLTFPDLTEEGDDPIHVVIKNPRMVPAQDLVPPDMPQQDDGDDMATFLAGCAVIARLIKAWHVYDASDEGDDQAPLPLPATAELVAKLPLEIQQRIGEEIQAVRSPGK